MTPLSILDLVPVSQGMETRTALDESLALAKLADRLGYRRYWYAEHHNVPTFASSATSLLIGRAAENTSRIRLGSGGVMLPNHSPLMVAEYYGTLAAMYGDRFDLGLGRAPGTDPRTAAALRRGQASADTFVEDVVELQRHLGDGTGETTAHPGQGTRVPLWILGSSLDGATVAAAMGLPYVFASHFAPAARHEAIRRYRENFSTDYVTAELSAPYVMAGVNVLVAPTDEEAEHLFTTAQQLAAGIGTGRRTPLAPPVGDIREVVDAGVLAFIEDFQQVRAVGSPQTVVTALQEIIADLGVDELIITTYTFDPAMRARSFELLAEAWEL
ncbi:MULTISPECIES: LLM class flavin-dependent oxidoreductase [Brevibacterium]|uniref:LLM class flavin-dependent oxidoreductase n=1 Tax=Brevibacterium casei TaxID=33889 RepID=A0A7T4A061_9MICO|nr:MULTISPECIES: LLM class flavin-dependent oxidoreductase [Brevibacterium]QQB14815.1 LLM class flavin-dependent oxidoreductase [Brevibacterium casei]